MQRPSPTAEDSNPERKMWISFLIDLITIVFLAIYIFKGDFLFGHYRGPSWAIYSAAAAALGNLLVLFLVALTVARMTRTRRVFFTLKCLLSLVTVGFTALVVATDLFGWFN
ncbi:MAG: hypothetical protein VX949_00555 [Planctomycetota bacterium]|nr:hypothetical protein [Planctomycetota bacterium]MEE2855862.1 hypothetical protein [Planctomycetota bacterium]